jgi:hypothetical protein
MRGVKVFKRAKAQSEPAPQRKLLFKRLKAPGTIRKKSNSFEVNTLFFKEKGM